MLMWFHFLCKVLKDKGLYCQHLAAHNEPIPMFQCTACGKVLSRNLHLYEELTKHLISKGC